MPFSQMRSKGAVLLVCLFIPAAAPFALPSLGLPSLARAARPTAAALLLHASSESPDSSLGRRSFLAGAAGVSALGALGKQESAWAEDLAVATGPKRVGISDDELRAAVEKDVVQQQFMVTGALTRELYDESCTFTDEIDTYTLDKWVKGTALLFKNDYSKMEFDGPISVSSSEVSFRWKEQLMFNIPVLKPKVQRRLRPRGGPYTPARLPPSRLLLQMLIRGHTAGPGAGAAHRLALATAGP